MAQIEEKRLKFFDKPPIDTFEELQVRGAIITNFNNDDYTQRDQPSSERVKEEKKGSKKKAKKGKSGVLDSDDKNQSSS